MSKRDKAFHLVIPLDASGVRDFDPKHPVKVMTLGREGIRQVQVVELSSEGVGVAEFTFEEPPGDLRVLVGPASASEDELEGMQTLQVSIPSRLWRDESILKHPRIIISPYFWHWWLRWCRTFTIRGRVVCPNGDPVPGANVCVSDVDRFFIWTSTEEVGCATTDANGAFEITFRWCCGWWPWWWLRHRFWEIDFVLWAKLEEWLHKIKLVDPIPIPGPRPDPVFLEKLLELHAEVEPGPRPPVAKVGPETAAMLAPSSAFASPAPEKIVLDPLRIEELRPRLAERLPRLLEIPELPLYPWHPWHPWWDCNPDVIFKVTQIQGGEEVVLVEETPADTRWNIGTDTNVVLVANENAWCLTPEPGCEEGNCLAFTTVCGNPVDHIGGNLGALASPRGYLNPGWADIKGDRPYAGVIPIHGTATCLTNVDYYKFQWSDDGGSTWQDMPPAAIGAVVRGYIDFDLLASDPTHAFPKIAFTAQHIDGEYVLETIAHYESTHPASGWGSHQVWAYQRDRLFVWKTANHFPDGEYLLRVVGYDLVSGHLQNQRVLRVCQQRSEAHLVLRLDNRLVTSGPNDAYGTPCGAGTVHTCTNEPATAILGMRIRHPGGDVTEIGACGFVEVGPNDQLEIDFMAYDPDGHLSYYTLDLTYGNNLKNNLLGHLALPTVTLAGLAGGPAPAAAQVGPDYPKALSQGAASPTWHGGVMRLTMPASLAFPKTCSYQLELWAHKRTIVNCDHSLWPHSNLSERSFAVKKV